MNEYSSPYKEVGLAPETYRRKKPRAKVLDLPGAKEIARNRNKKRKYQKYYRQ